ncbi:MAG: sensor domain-containing diguanylate cyclase [Acidobacteria bacterium]|nr:sensor domain-containing diguanylate cyclase [Acidobacteriota bacterium]
MILRAPKCLIFSEANAWLEALPRAATSWMAGKEPSWAGFNLVAIGQSLNAKARNAVIRKTKEASLPWFLFEDRHQENADQVLSDPILPFLLSPNAQLSDETQDTLQLKTLVEIITTANSLLQPRQVMDSVMDQIAMLVPCEAWSVLILTEINDTKMLEFAATSGPKTESLVKHRIPSGEGIAGWVVEHNKPLIVNQPENDTRFFRDMDAQTQYKTENILAAPLISRGRTIGVIEMLNRRGQKGFSGIDLELVTIFVNPVAVAIENAYLFQKTELLTIQDDLTKLYNARHLSNCFDFELQRAKRLKQPLSVLFLDLDGFKGVNDRFGHLQGSRSLIEVAEIIKQAARETDIVGRYGGDEFMVILPATGTGGAFAVAERIRENVEKYQPRGHKLSASIGIASFPDHSAEKERLFALADKAMYWVKEHGKNGIAVARGDGFVKGEMPIHLKTED